MEKMTPPSRFQAKNSIKCCPQLNTCLHSLGRSAVSFAGLEVQTSGRQVFDFVGARGHTAELHS